MEYVNLQTLAAICVLTTATTECIKNWLKVMEKPYSSNIISAIVAFILSVFVVVIKPVCIDLENVTPAMIYNLCVMSFFGMLSSNLGFDKVKELILALKG